MGRFLFYKLSWNDKRFLIVSAIFTLLFVTPIIHANFYYKEDLSRVIGGGFWFWNGRLVTSALYLLLNFGYSTKDIAPFPQILGGFFLFCSTFFIYRLFFASVPPFIAALCSLFFFAHPFFLTNLSYRYDALGMAASLLFVALSAYLLSGKKPKTWGSLGLLLLALLTYQVSLSVFVGLGLLLFATGITNRAPQESIKTLLHFGFVSLGAYILYSIVTKPFLAGWIASRTMVPLNIQGLQNVWANITLASGFFWQVFNDPITWVLFLFPFVLGWVYSIVEFFAHFKAQPIYYKMLFAVLIILLPVFLFLAMLLPIFPLEEPLIHARVYMGFCVLLLYTFIFWIRFAIKFKRPLLRTLIVLPFLYYLMASYSYSNAQAIQKEWEENLTREMIADLREAKVYSQVHTIVVSGREPLGAGVQNILKKYPLFTDSILRNIDEDDPRPTYFLLKFPLLQITQMYKLHELPKNLQGQEQKLKSAPIIAQNHFYTLRVLKDILFIQYPKDPQSL